MHEPSIPLIELREYRSAAVSTYFEGYLDKARVKETGMVRWIGAALACLVATTAQSETVRIVRDAASVAECDRLGEVRGSSLIAGGLGVIGNDNMISEMQEKVAAVNGNSLLMNDTQTGIMGAKGIGEAYRCEARAPAATKRCG